MAPEPDSDVPAPGTLPEEEQQTPADGHLVGRRRPDGKRIDEVGDPVPLDRHPHHG
jgi:hypothetical protein